MSTVTLANIIIFFMFFVISILLYMFARIRRMEKRLVDISPKDVLTFTERITELVIETERIAEELEFSISQKESLLQDLLSLTEEKYNNLENLLLNHKDLLCLATQLNQLKSQQQSDTKRKTISSPPLNESTNSTQTQTKNLSFQPQQVKNTTLSKDVPPPPINPVATTKEALDLRPSNTPKQIKNPSKKPTGINKENSTDKNISIIKSKTNSLHEPLKINKQIKAPHTPTQTIDQTQITVYRMLFDGLSETEIAKHLGISIAEVERYLDVRNES